MRSPLLLAAALAALVSPGAAGEVLDLKGLVRRPVDVRNAGHRSILCQAEIAHWFATDLARIAPGEQARLDLYFDTLSGTFAVINTLGEALPVERAWCGVEGRTYETRWNLRLGRDRPQPRRLDCRAEGPSLLCR